MYRFSAVLHVRSITRPATPENRGSEGTDEVDDHIDHLCFHATR
jgi:hypothetical protein